MFQHLYLEAEKARLQKLLGEKLCQKKRKEFYLKMSILSHNLRLLFVIFITTLFNSLDCSLLLFVRDLPT